VPAIAGCKLEQAARLVLRAVQQLKFPTIEINLADVPLFRLWVVVIGGGKCLGKAQFAEEQATTSAGQACVSICCAAFVRFARESG